MAHLLELVLTFLIIVIALLMLLCIASLLFSKRWKRFIDSIDNDIDKRME